MVIKVEIIKLYDEDLDLLKRNGILHADTDKTNLKVALIYIKDE